MSVPYRDSQLEHTNFVFDLAKKLLFAHIIQSQRFADTRHEPTLEGQQGQRHVVCLRLKVVRLALRLNDRYKLESSHLV